MMKRPLTITVGLLVLAVESAPVHTQNVEEMVKWTSAQSIRYDVVAEYAGLTAILLPPAGSPITNYRTEVTDRYEVSFDWDPSAMSLVGKPVIRNFPSALPKGTPGASMMGQQCPSPKVGGAFDYVEVTGLKAGRPGSNSVDITIRRSYPAGAAPYAGDGACTNWLNVPAKTDTLTSGIVVPPGMYFAMPQAAGANVAVGKDGKTMTLVDKANGWKYTYTLQIVK